MLHSYHTCIFESFLLDQAAGTITFRYRVDDTVFTPQLELDLTHVDTVDALMAAAFTLGLAELPHFWKATRAPHIHIQAGALSEEQVRFWEHTWKHALGEFFYVHGIDPHTAFRVTADPHAPHYELSQAPLRAHALVPFGGGKDSVVTGEQLLGAEKSFAWFTLDRGFATEQTYTVSGNERHVSMLRDVPTYFREVIALHEHGAPNGHVSVTATYMASAVLAACLHGFQDVILSIERSANEANTSIGDFPVNHQYTKSFAFEEAFADYVRAHVHPTMRVFSLLRDSYELQIMQAFVAHPQYHPVFMSCNAGLQDRAWCGMCAKCAFVFAGLAAFMPLAEVTKLFGKNLFDDMTLLPLFRDLIGAGDHKPFECVGTYQENLLALYLAQERYVHEHHSRPLPPILAALDLHAGAAYRHLLDEVGQEHIIPVDYDKARLSYRRREPVGMFAGRTDPLIVRDSHTT